MVTAIVAACFSIGGGQFAVWAAGAVAGGMLVGAFVGFPVDAEVSTGPRPSFGARHVFLHVDCVFRSLVQTRRVVGAGAGHPEPRGPGAVHHHRFALRRRSRPTKPPTQPASEEFVSRQHEPRVAHAAQRDPRLGRDARRGRGARGPRSHRFRSRAHHHRRPAPARPRQRRADFSKIEAGRRYASLSRRRCGPSSTKPPSNVRRWSRNGNRLDVRYHADLGSIRD